ncbi:MAG: T9SS C-terminal target domain-containing protein [Flavobacteriales bacterium]|nr:MAG: T9SS C-terminal target domain-containing protein [Flavobacteriales bacterium]
MHRLIWGVFTFFLGFTAFAQQAVPSVSAKFLYTEYDKLPATIRASGDLPQNFVNRHALHYRNGQWMIPAVLKVDVQRFRIADLQNLGVTVGTILNDLVSIELPLDSRKRILEVEGVIYVEMGAPGDAPALDLAIADVRADSVKQGLGSMPQPFNGTGTVVGVIDWGFDFTHPTYYDTSGTRYRVARVWDQNKVGGTPPAGFTYGTEYRTQAEMLAAGHDDPYTFGIGSHGMHTSGIAAGSGLGTRFEGLASEADLILLPYRRGAAGLLDGMTYVRDYANAEGKPFVFNMSTGSHLGPHDGTSLKNQAITSIVGPGAVFVGSAGNNGQNNFHAKIDLDNLDTALTVMQIANMNRPDYWGNALPMWGSANAPFSVELMLMTNTLDTVFSSGWIHSVDNPSVDSIIVINGDSIHYKFEGIASDPNNSKPNIRLEIQNPTSLRTVLRFTGSGEVHCWNITRLEERYTNWGSDLTAGYLGFTFPNGVAGDPDYGVGEPAGVGPRVITVGAYKSREFSTSGIPLFGNLAPFTSFGPTVDGRMKPDIAGPGVAVASSVSSFDPSPGTSVGSVNWEGKTYNFVRFSGTSMSGPVVAGTVALMLQANPSMSWNHARDIIKATARQDNQTGPIPSTGHHRWGWGKLDAYAAVEMVLATVGAKRFYGTDRISVYPNPADMEIYIDLSEATSVHRIEIIDAGGRVLRTMENLSPAEQKLDVSQFKPGVYMLKTIDNAGRSSVYRLLIQR